MHEARKAFIEAESAERVRRALRHKFRSSSINVKQGDRVFYKRQDSNKWRGPGVVIGRDIKVIFVRHGSIYVRVSMNRIIKAGEEFNTHVESSPENIRSSESIKVSSKERDTSDEEELENTGSTADRADEMNTTTNDFVKESVSTNVSVNMSQQEGRDHPPTNSANLTFPKNKDKILFKHRNEESWKEGEVIGRAGKANGKYKSWVNIKLDNTTSDCINLDEVEWKIDCPNEEVNVTIQCSRHNEPEVVTAKKKELELWKEYNVYSEVIKGSQRAISTTWVVTEKRKMNNHVVKARLVARGFEEEGNNQVDSPTADRSTLRLLLALASTFQWKCKTLDIKSAFLQGKQIERDVFLISPPEHNKSNVLWKLNKVVYGLNDAARNWYQSVVKELVDLGCFQSKHDPALFTKKDLKGLQGILLIHVDDFIYAGSEQFENDVVLGVKRTFEVGKEDEGCFKYIGLNIQQKENLTTLDQQKFIESLNDIPINIKRMTRKFDDANEKEQQFFRAAVGQINWLASQSRPDIAFDVLEMSMQANKPKVMHLIKVNRLIKKLQQQQRMLVFPSLRSINKIVVYADASFANLPDGVSSAGGHLIFLLGEEMRSCLVMWASKKIKRVVKSTTAAEALALAEGLENAVFLQSMLYELLSKHVPIVGFTDSRNLAITVNSIKHPSIVEKRLRLDIASIKEMIETGVIESIQWVTTDKQLADLLTKKGVDGAKAMTVIEQGLLEI